MLAGDALAKSCNIFVGVQRTRECLHTIAQLLMDENENLSRTSPNVDVSATETGRSRWSGGNVGDVIAARAAYAISCGDAERRLSGLPSRCADLVITSPPYFRQKDYGVKGQLGWEAQSAITLVV